MRTFALSLALACTASFAFAQSAVAPSPVLVELFTSEGCSSCPPADAYLQRLDASQPIAAAQLIVLSEHVDYWNHDGWNDPFSAASFSARQADYVRSLRLSTAYTPQFVIDGSTDLRTDDPRQINQLFQHAAAIPKIPVRIASVRLAAGALQGRIEADAASAARSSNVYLVLALNHAESQVLHGENGGRHLNHVAVVQQFVKLGTLQKGGKFAQDFQLSLKPGYDPENLRLVVFLQEPATGKIVGSALQRKVN